MTVHNYLICTATCEFLREVVFQLKMHQSIQLRPAPPLGLALGISIFFFALNCNFPGVGTLELSKTPGWGLKKRASAPFSVNTATFFIDRTDRIVPF